MARRSAMKGMVFPFTTPLGLTIIVACMPLRFSAAVSLPAAIAAPPALRYVLIIRTFFILSFLFSWTSAGSYHAPCRLSSSIQLCVSPALLLPTSCVASPRRLSRYCLLLTSGHARWCCVAQLFADQCSQYAARGISPRGIQPPGRSAY